MTRHRILVVLAGTATIAAGGCLSDRTSGPTATLDGCDAQLPAEAFGSTIVIIRAFAFTPAQVKVSAGTKVTWVNCEAPAGDSHTTTADAGQWNSPLLPPGATFTQAFSAAGTFPYHCVPHPGMRGTVIVQ